MHHSCNFNSIKIKTKPISNVIFNQLDATTKTNFEIICLETKNIIIFMPNQIAKINSSKLFKNSINHYLTADRLDNDKQLRTNDLRYAQTISKKKTIRKQTYFHICAKYEIKYAFIYG